MKAKMIFGFGSLINEASLKRTVPDAVDIQPAYIKGYIRDFNILDSLGFRSGPNMDVAGLPYCALDVRKTKSTTSRVNGVVFSMSDTHFERLVEREYAYKLVETVAYDYHGDKIIGECFVFSACKNDATFDAECAAQIRYLQICLVGAQSLGDAFYEEFLNTTFINGKPLVAWPQYIDLALKTLAPIAAQKPPKSAKAALS